MGGVSDFDYQRAFQNLFGELDGRLKRPMNVKWGAAGPVVAAAWVPVYCYCGTWGGYATEGIPILYVCDKCTETIGKLPLQEVLVDDPNFWPAGVPREGQGG